MSRETSWVYGNFLAIIRATFPTFIILGSWIQAQDTLWSPAQNWGKEIVTTLVFTVVKCVVFGREDWHYCAACEAVAPPRAWHCSTCRQVEYSALIHRMLSKIVCFQCILKREHHCMFAGYCVGHFNHRYEILTRIVFPTIQFTFYYFFVFQIFYPVSGLDMGWGCLLHVSELCLRLSWGQLWHIIGGNKQ